MSQGKLPICTACGSQYDFEAGVKPINCRICDDPRQFVPPSGQSWTSLSQINESHHNEWQPDSVDARISFFWTEPKFAIGQRAFLLQTNTGNILWDMIGLIDAPTAEKIRSLGGLKAIVISHPHYYTTYVEWYRVFKCPIYVGSDDRNWLCQKPPSSKTLRFIQGPAGATQSILPGVTAIKTGGHFSGSLVLHWEKKLFIADTIVTVPSAYTPHPRPPEITSYVFEWSIPNMIPLPPDEINNIWQAIKPFDFDTTHGAFVGMDVRDEKLKERMLDSMKIQVEAEGWKEHAIFGQTVTKLR